MKSIIFILVLSSLAIKVFGQKKVYDESKYFQLRAMETGPWEFSPRGYYYSWVRKKILFVSFDIPGAGIHDHGPGGQKWIYPGSNYVNDFAPNKILRAELIAEAKLQEKEYNKIEAAMKEIKKMEEINSIDRSINLVEPGLKSRIKKINILLSKNILEYDNMFKKVNIYDLGHSESIYREEKEERDELTLNFIEEKNAIMQKIEILRDAHISNSKRLEGYNKYILELQELNSKIVRITKFRYINKKITK